MREEFELVADAEALETLYQQQASADFLHTLFGTKGNANYAVLCRALEAYHNKDGGSPEVCELELIDVRFNPKSGTGSFRAKFSLHFHYTCSDVHNDAKDTISWEFKINKETGTVKFTGEEPWVRDAE